MTFVDAGKDAFSFLFELGAQWWTVGWCWWYTVLMTYAYPSFELSFSQLVKLLT